jgi:hypothetical protein
VPGPNCPQTAKYRESNPSDYAGSICSYVIRIATSLWNEALRQLESNSNQLGCDETCESGVKPKPECGDKCHGSVHTEVNKLIVHNRHGYDGRTIAWEEFRDNHEKKKSGPHR